MNPRISTGTADRLRSSAHSDAYSRLSRIGVRTLLILLLLVGLALTVNVRQVSINGTPVTALGPLTAGECAGLLQADLRPGDLYDISGDLLRQGGGKPGIILVNGRIAGAGDRIESGDSIGVIPGSDSTEPIKLQAKPVTPVVRRGDSYRPLHHLTASGIGGLKYVSYGSVSGKLHGVQFAQLAPTPPSEGKARRIALTFDDGPNPSYTPQIVEILQRHNARATFFTVGTFAKKYPQLVQMALDSGNEVACHTWGHPDCTKLSDAEVRKQISWWKSACPAHQDATVRWFRPPYGATNSTVREICSNAGFRTILWTGDTRDWMRPGSDTIYSRALAAARDGACILMHDGGGPRNQTVAALRRIVPELQRRGYELVTLSELYGYELSWDNDFLIETETGTLELKQLEEDLQVQINGELIDLPVEPVEIDGQLLLPARPTLQMLGCRVSFDKSARELTVFAPTKTLSMNLNRCTLTIGERETWMAVPPVFFRGHSMIPLWLLLEHCGARAAYDPLHTTLCITGEYGLTPVSLNGENRVRLSLSDDAPWQERLSILR